MRLTLRDNEMIAKGRQVGRLEGRQEGRQEEQISSIRNLMDTLKLTAQQAMDALKISETDQQRYLSLL